VGVEGDFALNTRVCGARCPNQGSSRPTSTLWLRAVGSAKRTSSGGRAGRRRDRAAFFTAPEDVAQRRYEALRAYFVEDATAAQVAARFGYAPSSVVAMVRDFSPEAGEFFVERRPGPRVAPAKPGSTKAPDNRHEEGNGRVLHRRLSESRWPRPCVGVP